MPTSHDAAQLLSRYRDLLEAAPDAMVIVGRDGRIVLVNSEAEHLFGYARSELLGQSVDLLVPTALRSTHGGHRTHFFDAPQRRPMGSGLKLAARRKDGTQFPVEISLSPVASEDGMLVTAAVRDVSARVRADAALEATNQEMESFTYSVSHDLRAPIRQIDGFARLLAESLGPDVDEKSRHYLTRIQDGARHMGRLVDDLLLLARVGRTNVRLVPTELGDVLAEAIAELQPEVANRSIEWTIDPLPRAKCDPGLMKIVFTNLLSNAIKYTRPRPQATIAVGGGMRDARIVISVQDNGVGFDMRYADQLFGAFQRLHGTDDFEGSGVGLATVQRIVRKHGGDIWAEAAPDKGATFSFALGPECLVPEGRPA